MSELPPLSITHPELAKQAFGWDPTSITSGSGLIKEWRCLKNHVWKSKVANRTQGNGCPICSNHIILEGFNDLHTTHPGLSLEVLGWDPRKIGAGSFKKLNWKCNLGHIWEARVNSRARGSGCPFCDGKSVWTGFNDLATARPDLAIQAFKWDPKKVTLNSAKKLEWICELKHIWTARVYDRVKSDGCPICSGRRIQSGFNDLATTHPNLIPEVYGWDASKIGAGSDSKRKWKCSEGHIWTARISSRKTGVGCPTCSVTGFDPNEDGWLYFLQHPDWEMLQIGITNSPDDRLSTHKHLGWELLELRGPMNGDLARQWETEILRMLRRKKAIVGSTDIAGKFTGYTESWMKASFPANSIKELMENVRALED
jgi:hypothetical protein